MSDTNNEESQLLDDDVLPEEFPPDRPLGVDQRLTPEEEQVGESLADRVAREEPEPLVQVLDEEVVDGGVGSEVGTLVAPGGEGGTDVEGDEVASVAGEDAALGALDVDDIASGDDTLRDMAQERMHTRPAEEAAMHITEDPPMGDGDGYVDDSTALRCLRRRRCRPRRRPGPCAAEHRRRLAPRVGQRAGLGVADRRPHPLGRARHVDVAHAEVGERRR